MRTRSTILLLLFVLGLGAFVYLYERHQASTLEAREPGKLLGADPQTLESIEMKSPLGRVVWKKIQKPERWVITEPYDDFPDTVALDRLFWLIKEATIAEILGTEKQTDSQLKEFGLDDASAFHISLKANGKILHRINLGKTGTLGESCYVSLPEAKNPKTVYLVYAKGVEKDMHIRDALARPLNDFRSKDLLPMKANGISKFSVQRADGTGELELQRNIADKDQATPWLLTKPLQCRADQKRIDDLVAAFAESAPQMLPPDTTPTGVEKPAAEVTFYEPNDPKGHPLKLYAAKPNEPTILAYASRRKTWLRLDPAFLEVLPTSANDFRSKYLGNLEVSKITTVIIEEPAKATSKLYRVADKWFLEQGEGKFVKGSEQTVKRTIRDINEAEVGDFVTDSMTDPSLYGLDKPFLTATFSNPQHESLAKLSPVTADGTRVLQFGFSADKRLYANYKGEPSVFLMMPEHIQLIPSTGLAWKDPHLLSFSPYQILSLQQTVANSPPITISRPVMTLVWTRAERAGADVLPLLDPNAVEMSLDRLSTLSVENWLPPDAGVTAALESPSLEIQTTVMFKESAEAPEQQKTIRLTLAPAGSINSTLVFYGKCTDIADHFSISRKTYEQLARPWLRAAAK